MGGKYYKVILHNSASPTREFDYTRYLPRGGSAGEWLPAVENTAIRSGGYYVSKNWRIWYVEGARVFEVECEGLVSENLNGVEKQACCRRIRLLREVTDECRAENSDAALNKGCGNIGKANVGDANIGNFNIGSRNVGNLNSGDFNTGDSNTGIDNVGNDNLGSLNSGSSNVGHSNTGSFNRGSFNSGDYNTGHANSGSFNRGNRNSGKWNLCNYSNGFFNTRSPEVYMFDKPTGLTAAEVRLPKWLQKGDLEVSLKSADADDLRATFALPNFDAAIFERITGISAERISEEIERRG